MQRHFSVSKRRLVWSLGAAALALFASGAACSRPERGQLMLSFSTDMDVNADVGAVGLAVNLVGGKSLSQGIYPVVLDPATGKYTPQLPSTLAVVSNGESIESVRVQLVAYKDSVSRQVLGLREVVSQVPLQKLRTTRVPVTWLSGVRFNQNATGPSASPTNITPTSLRPLAAALGPDGRIPTGCAEDEVFTASGCTKISDDALSQATEGAPAEQSQCVNVNACYTGGISGDAAALVFWSDGACYAMVPNPAANLNLAVATNSEALAAGFSLAAPVSDSSSAQTVRKLIPLEPNLPLEGWTLGKVVVSAQNMGSATDQVFAAPVLEKFAGQELVFPKLAPAICGAVRAGQINYVYATAACTGLGGSVQACTNANPAKAEQPVDTLRASVVSTSPEVVQLLGGTLLPPELDASVDVDASRPMDASDVVASDAADADANGDANDAGDGGIPLPTDVLADALPVQTVIAGIGEDVFGAAPAGKTGVTQLFRVGAPQAAVDLPGMPSASLRLRALPDPLGTEHYLVVWSEADPALVPGADKVFLVRWNPATPGQLTIAQQFGTFTGAAMAGFRVNDVARDGGNLFLYGGPASVNAPRPNCYIAKAPLAAAVEPVCTSTPLAGGDFPFSQGQRVVAFSQASIGDPLRPTNLLVVESLNDTMTAYDSRQVLLCYDAECGGATLAQGSISSPVRWIAAQQEGNEAKFYWRTHSGMTAKLWRTGEVPNAFGAPDTENASFSEVNGLVGQDANGLGLPRATLLDGNHIYADVGDVMGVRRIAGSDLGIVATIGPERFPLVDIGASEPTSFAILPPAMGGNARRLCWSEVIPTTMTSRIRVSPLP
jgi:hypothetical protein